MTRRLLGAARAAALLAGIASAIGGRRPGASPGEATGGQRAAAASTGALRRWGLTALALLTVAGILGGLVVVSGVVPIKASAGHWAITEWFLQFAKRRSVATHTLGTSVPPLEDEHLVLKGAGHFESACRPCHGSPSFDQPRIAARMLPRPPDLREAVRTYDPAELFYIVKHGIKLTGMPAWPAPRRDDEVWAMVAFLRRLPALDARRYAELASGPSAVDARVPLEELVPPDDVPGAIAESCGRCHGLDGAGRGIGAFPRLAGQRPAYLRASLEAYARGERHSGIMEPVAAGLGLDEMQRIAEYYSRLPASTDLGGPPRQQASLELGREIAHRGIPDKLVPACVECHGPGQRDHNPAYPRLAGQYADYLALQLTLFKEDRRGGTSYQGIMRKVAGQLTEGQMRAVAEYYASLGAYPGRAVR